TLDGARLEHINPTASLIRAGIPTVLGSDNLPIGPMVGLYAAITRKGPSGHVYAADEAISRAQAITLYTAKAAWLTRDERKKGSIEKGKLADMIVLDADILTIPAEQILTTRVDMTMAGPLFRRLGIELDPQQDQPLTMDAEPVGHAGRDQEDIAGLELPPGSPLDLVALDQAGMRLAPVGQFAA
ncbi:hypothetical protein E4T56_gene444, partial [Termitomyces sp. T112]